MLLIETLSGGNGEGPKRSLPGSVCSGFVEGTAYRIRKPSESSVLVIDDQDLENDIDYWYWSPQFFAGQVKVELFDLGNSAKETFVFDVSPHKDKLGQREFQAMLEEIWAVDPELVIGTEPAQTPIGHSSTISAPWLEFSRLRTYGQAFTDSLDQIAQRPIRELRSERRQLPIQYVRKADRQTAMAATRNPATVSALMLLESRGAFSGSTPLFDVPFNRESLDSAANRCIAAQTRNVMQRTLALKKRLEEMVDGDIISEARSDLAARWPRRRAFLSRIATRLRRAQHSLPLSAVSRAEISAAGLNAISADPHYSGAYRLAWRMLRRGVEGCPDSETLWISPTWEIYERWCFVRLCETLCEHFGRFNWKRSDKHVSGAKCVFAGSDNTGSRIELLFQPKFAAIGQKERSGFRSVSKAREPDIVLIIRKGAAKHWMVFDAKYRTKRSYVLDAMTSAHVYQDSLRLEEQKPDVSLLLVPRSNEVRALEEVGYSRANRVGVRPMTTSQSTKDVARLLHLESAINSGSPVE